jgi:quinol monooxygenase YgiN
LHHLVIAVLALATVRALPAGAQAPAGAPVFAVAYVEVVPRARQATIGELKRYRDASRADAGQVRIDLLEQVGRPGHFAIIEAWRDQRALDAHATATHVRRLRDALQPIRLSAYDERPYGAFSVSSMPRAENRQTVRVVTHVDIGGGAAGAPQILLRLAEASRREPGCLRFDVLQHTTRANHFTVIESWTDPSALEAHAAAAHTREYRDALQPLSGSPLDERLYKILE